jgi:hypothetical protein
MKNLAEPWSPLHVVKVDADGKIVASTLMARL